MYAAQVGVAVPSHIIQAKTPYRVDIVIIVSIRMPGFRPAFLVRMKEDNHFRQHSVM